MSDEPFIFSQQLENPTFDDTDTISVQNIGWSGLCVEIITWNIEILDGLNSVGNVLFL